MQTSTISLTPRVYTPSALEQTAAVFAEICTASITVGEDVHILRITASRQQITDEFLNYALGLSAQELLR